MNLPSENPILTARASELVRISGDTAKVVLETQTSRCHRRS
jgi:hypothetical protein